MKYYNKQTVVEATQWQVLGDHPAVYAFQYSGWHMCPICGLSWTLHGAIQVSHCTVCPNDYIVTENGKHTLCKPEIFSMLYGPIKE